jgi:ABC-2 type transport system permease protein
MSRLLAAEGLKLVTTRSALVLLAVVGVLAGVGVAGTIGVDAVADEGVLADLVAGTAVWLVFAALLGILLATNEYRYGTVTRTFLVTPVRERVLAAKLFVGGAGGLALGIVAILVTLAVAIPWLGARGELRLEGALGAASGRVALAFALTAALGVALGALVRSQVWAIAAAFAWFLIVESLLGLVAWLVLRDDEEVDRLVRFLPGSALGAVVGGDGPADLPFWTAAAVALGWVAVVSAVSVVALRRDVT